AGYDARVSSEGARGAGGSGGGVLGKERAEASGVGELGPSPEFYDYPEKYVGDGARIVIPAELPTDTAETMRALALRAFHAVDGSGLARVDFFLERGTNRVLVNEINTMPGFTRASQYPRLWEAAGGPSPALVERLARLSPERHAARGRRRLSFSPPGPMSAAPRSSRGGR